jgi:EF-P beta-lysylation protein EpmB
MLRSGLVSLANQTKSPRLRQKSGMPIVASPPHPVLTGSNEESWQQAMKSAIRDSQTLCRHLELPEAYGRAADCSFPLFAPLGFVNRMRPGDPHDPLLRQVLPLAEESMEVAGFNGDPVQDKAATLRPGLLKKYAGRVLLVTTGACAIHCRYCFRRHYPYGEGPHSLAQWEAAIDEIAADRTIEEVILSGGDPLTLVDARLAELAERLAEIPHLRRLRVHTRLPVVIPERVTGALVKWLSESRLVPIVVVHANHAAELDESVAGAFERLTRAGIMLLNQTVLLRGVNDSLAALSELSRRLIDLRVVPYYLHQLDRVRGAAHFEVPVERGRELVRQLRDSMPGYAVPTYVQEIAGQPSKQIQFPAPR